jgi:hypothetical protein
MKKSFLTKYTMFEALILQKLSSCENICKMVAETYGKPLTGEAA